MSSLTGSWTSQWCRLNAKGRAWVRQDPFFWFGNSLTYWKDFRAVRRKKKNQTTFIQFLCWKWENDTRWVKGLKPWPRRAGVHTGSRDAHRGLGSLNCAHPKAHWLTYHWVEKKTSESTSYQFWGRRKCLSVLILQGLHFLFPPDTKVLFCAFRLPGPLGVGGEAWAPSSGCLAAHHSDLWLPQIWVAGSPRH